MKKTKMVCTLGPASDSKEILTKMIQGGLNVAFELFPRKPRRACGKNPEN